mmetsp:Transcript_41262/g.62828  ORF Transcript_41262/g.62828 Transcript_41262/m.62828 type:complete len:119 (-) Transcript_41262:333-689(-)
MHSKLPYKPVEEQAGKSPGPGAYESHFRNKKQAPSYGLGLGQRSFVKTKAGLEIPGSNSYNPSMTYTMTQGAKWGFGSEERKGPIDKKQSQSPGPGNYELDSVAFDTKNPRFFVGKKL